MTGKQEVSPREGLPTIRELLLGGPSRYAKHHHFYDLGSLWARTSAPGLANQQRAVNRSCSGNRPP